MDADPRLYNMDCIEGARAHLADASVDLIVTDPPYGIEGDRLHRHYNRDERFVIEGYVEVERPRYAEFSAAWIAQAERVLRPGGQLYIVSGYTNLPDILTALRSTSLRELNHIIWKYNFGVYTSTKFVSSHYHILYYAKPGGRRTFNLQARFALDEVEACGGSANYRDREDVWIINREYKPGRAKNKNELPRALLEKMIAYSSNVGDVVCDFFMGGGSTGAVAVGMSREFAGFEVSQRAFRRCSATLKDVEPGSMLASAPRPHIVRNRGKPWSSEEMEQLHQRYELLAAGGSPKRMIVSTLSNEFARGAWAIRKRLRLLAIPSDV
ncbi:MAG TPA: site-specific DNA-methyltransferase [Candidatus Baltobacteraceae bacterium]|jgi:site-specific DNA-methyltransferase (adenine-specific)|nr:site-specific DNA-methyltransferase [Candidatus Baltobacteraceae bacterium]